MMEAGMFYKRTWYLVMTLLCMLPGMTLSAWGAVENPRAETKAAVVNGAAIMENEVDGEVLLVQKAIVAAGKPLDCGQISSIRKEVIESMIKRELLYQESSKAGIKADQAAVNKELDALKKQFPGEAEYKNELSLRNLSEETLRARLAKNLAVQKYVGQKFAATITVTNDEMMAYYQTNLNLFRQPLQVRVSHILIQTDTKWEASRKQEARRKIEEILKGLKKGDDFAALARERSDGPTRTDGGEIGYVRMGQLEKQLETVVFSLKPGETSEIIETDYGFHVFRVTDKKPESVSAYEDVKEKIQRFLREEKAKQEAYLQINKLREKAVVEILN
jgi:peptidyl-prolyl cis-trans isomerase C